MLIPNKHSGYQTGIRLYPGGKGGSSAPAPDPKLIEAQIRSMGFQDDAIQSIMKASTDMAPLQKEQLQFGLDSARTAYDQSQDDRAFLLDRREKLSGVQDTILKDAATFNTEDKQNELAGLAMADVNQGFASAEGQNTRAMARMGVNPSSGRSAAMSNQTAIAKAAALAGASTGARTGARLEGRALTDRASNTLAGYPSMSMQATGQGAGIGASGITIANTGLAGLNSGSMQAGQLSAQLGSNAAGMYGAVGGYKSQQDKLNEGESFGSILGGLGGAAAGAAKLGLFSDRRLKENIVLVGRDGPTGLNLYEFNYTFDANHRFRGVMADEVAGYMPAAVIRGANGFDSVDYALIGIQMVEV